MAINENAIDFLLDKSNVAIKYRVLRDLCDNSNSKDLIRLQDELINSERSIHLLECLKNCKEYRCNLLLLKVDLMSSFSSASNSKWFTQALGVMEQYADENGIYHYPKNYLTEKDSCWILDNHMSIGENRRQKHSMTIEGTFRTLLIMKKMSYD